MKRFDDEYRVLFQSNPQPMWVYEVESLAFLAVNESAILHYGYSKNEFLAMTILDIRPLEDIPRLKAALPNDTATPPIKVHQSGTWRHRKKDGTLIEMQVYSEPVLFEGRPARLVLLNDVTELKRSTVQLHLLETCISRLNDIVMITDSEPLDEPGPRIVFVNEAFVRRTGYSREEALGRSPRFLQGPRTSRPARDRVRRALEAQKPIREEVLNYTKSGEEIWLELEIAPVVDETGRCTHFVSIEREVTERKIAEKALSQSEARLNEAQRLSHIGNWEWNVSERRVSWSNELYRIFGLEPQEFPITAESFPLCIHPEERETMRKKIEDMRRHARAFQEDYRILRPDGTVRHVCAIGEVASDENAKVTKLMGTVQDVTDRKHTEHELQKALALFKTTLEATADGILVVDQTGKVVTYNRKFRDMWRIPEELAGLKDDAKLVSYVLAQLSEPETFLNKIRDLMNQNEAESEDELRFKDGRVFERYSQPHRLGAEIVGRVWSFRDVTDRQHAEENRIRTAKLETANRELEAFSYSVSHDLRAPLRTIDGFSRMLLEDYYDKLDDNARSYLDLITNATKRMGQLIQDLLNLSKITSSEMSRSEVNLSAIVENIAGELRQLDPERKAVFRIAPNLTAHADPRLMRIALENLLRNAWKFTGNIPAAEIEFGTSRKDREPVFFIRDNGAGFDMAFAAKLFGVFQRLHPEAEFAGTGIGLATVARIITRHGGKVWAEAAVDQGATFYFTLPG
jgi:PAS domain S-box-containing protein